MKNQAQLNDALNRAVNGTSTSNHSLIMKGFTDKGIPAANILPRENVLTYAGWLALGRVVKKGEKGVRISVGIDCYKKLDEEGNQKVPVRKWKDAYVFHISQTKLIEDDSKEKNNKDSVTQSITQKEKICQYLGTINALIKKGLPEAVLEYQLNNLGLKPHDIHEILANRNIQGYQFGADLIDRESKDLEILKAVQLENEQSESVLSLYHLASAKVS